MYDNEDFDTPFSAQNDDEEYSDLPPDPSHDMYTRLKISRASPYTVLQEKGTKSRTNTDQSRRHGLHRRSSTSSLLCRPRRAGKSLRPRYGS
jgi:hypothetical protein